MDTCRQCSAPSDDDQLCESCAGRLDRCRGLLPEHIAGSNQLGDAWLVDPWGRAHPVQARGTIVGRAAPAVVMLVHETVSREHARVWRRKGDRWSIEDLDSKNGTVVDGGSIEIGPLADKTQVLFGKVPMWFEVERGDRVEATAVSTVLDRGSDQLIVAMSSPAGFHLELRATAADAGIALGSASGGPPWNTLEVPRLELALLVALTDRARANRGSSTEHARCIPTRELASALPFRTAYPDDQNVRQLVRRTRTLLASLGVEKLIGSRPPYGYLLEWELG